MRSRDEILDLLYARKAEIRHRFSAERIGVFGSCARGVARADSDIRFPIWAERSAGKHRAL